VVQRGKKAGESLALGSPNCGVIACWHACSLQVRLSLRTRLCTRKVSNNSISYAVYTRVASCIRRCKSAILVPVGPRGTNYSIDAFGFSDPRNHDPQRRDLMEYPECGQQSSV
jgi:hypothetical protein